MERRAGRDEAEEAYGDYQLVVDAIADRLLDIRESYARSLDEDAAERVPRRRSRARRRRATAATRRCSPISTLEPCDVSGRLRATARRVARLQKPRELEMRRRLRRATLLESERPSA